MESEVQFFGRFTDIDAHSDDQLFSKEEPPNHIGSRFLPKKRLDFLITHPSGAAGIEVKNLREWIYPDKPEVKELLLKCCTLDIVPVLIARRIHYSTFSVLSECGLIIHETYNQRFAFADAALAAKASDKNLLGYHDIRVGNAPDDRLMNFITVNLPAVLPKARSKFDQFKDLLLAYSENKLPLDQFVILTRQRRQSLNLTPPAPSPPSGPAPPAGHTAQ